jgi:hypothetical protein
MADANHLVANASTSRIASERQKASGVGVVWNGRVGGLRWQK